MKIHKFLPVLLFFICAMGTSVYATPPAAPNTRTVQSLNNVPLAFEVNSGQADKRVEFLCRGAGYVLFIDPEEAVLNLQRNTASIDNIRMKLVGANPTADGEAIDKQRGVVSYFIGNDPSQWHSGVPTYGKVRYANIYPGIDLVFYGNQRQLEYDFVVSPGADPSRIAWQIEGALPRIAADGNLDLNTPNGPASFKRPLVYQMDGDKRVTVDGAFTVAGDSVGFRVDSYDRSQPLIIDPVLVYASYLGGSGTDNIGNWNGPGILGNNPSQGLAIDSTGSVYVTGYTTSSVDFPLSGNPYQSVVPTKGTSARSVFVSKFSSDGSSLEYSTYIAGSGWDSAYAIAVDSSGNAYVTGQTNSNDFPITSGAFQKLCFPNPANPPNPISSNCGSTNASAFLTKLNSTGTALLYSTFLGGYGGSYGTAIAVDNSGRAYVAGVESIVCNPLTYAYPACFPTTTGAVINGTEPNGRSPQYAFLTVFDAAGAHLLYSTLFGDLDGLGDASLYGSGSSLPGAVAVDASGNFYMAGFTQASHLPTTSGALQETSGPKNVAGNGLQAWRGMVTKFSPVSAGGISTLSYATYFGGSVGSTQNFISGITTDSEGNIYLVGNTNYCDIPVTEGAYETACGTYNNNSASAAFVTKLNPSGTKDTQLVWSSYVGGAKQGGSDNVSATGPIALDGRGNVYIEGTMNNGFPMVNPVEPAPIGGNPQVLIAELDPTGSQLLFSTGIGAKGLDGVSPAGLAVDATGNIYVAGNVNGADLVTTSGAFQTTSPDNITCCGLGNGFVADISPLLPTKTTLAIAPATAAYGQDVTFTATVTPSVASSLIPAGSVIFKDALGNILGSGVVNPSGVVIFASSGLSTATYSVTAIYAGDDNFMTSTSSPQTLVVSGGQTQTITFGALPSVIYGVGPIDLTATASSGLPVTYSVAGPATLIGSTLNIIGSGGVTVTASQAGNSNWGAAPNVIQSFTVLPASLTVTAGSASVSYGQPIPALTYTITGFVNGDISTVVSGVPVESTTATSTSAPGQYPITITVGTLAATNYTFAFISGAINITTATQTITFGALPNVAYGVSPITLSATASSNLTLTYSVTGPASLNGSALTVKGAGAVTITASQMGNGDYAAATPVSQSFTVNPAVLTISPSNASMSYGQAVPNLTYTASGFVNGETASVLSGVPHEATTATSTSAPGTYPITITQGSLLAVNYTFAFVNGTLTITKASQTITFNTIPAQIVAGSVALVASASSGLLVSFSSLTSTICTVSGFTATLLAAGRCTIQASQSGNGNYLAATSVSQSFQVSSAVTGGFTITVIPPVEITRGHLASFILDLKSINGFKGTVKLSCSGAPVGANCDVFPPSIYLSREAFAVAGVIFPRITNPGTYTIKFTGTSGATIVNTTARVSLK